MSTVLLTFVKSVVSISVKGTMANHLLFKQSVSIGYLCFLMLLVLNCLISFCQRILTTAALCYLLRDITFVIAYVLNTALTVTEEMSVLHNQSDHGSAQ